MLNHYYSPYKTRTQIELSELYYLMYQRFMDKKRDGQFINNMNAAFEWLHDNNYINVLKKDSNDSNKYNCVYIINMSSLFVKLAREFGDPFWVKIRLGEIQTICMAKTKGNKFNLLSFFIELIGAIFNGEKYHSLSMEHMSTKWGFSPVTIRDYLKELEMLKLIYVYRPNKREFDTYKRLGHTYGRYEDKDVIKNSVMLARKGYDIPKTEFNPTSISLRLRHFIEGCKPYEDDKAVFKLYKDILELNEYYDRSEKPNNKKDLTSFEEYINEKLETNSLHKRWSDTEILKKEEK